MTQVASANKPPAIVIGLDCITGLQTARILAREGVPVIGIARNPNHFCCKTKVCRQIVEANTASEELIDTLEALSAGLGEKAVLVPCTDMSVLQISNHRDRLADRYHIALPSRETVDLLINKINFYTFAAKEDLPIPKTFFLTNRQEAEEAAGKLSFPCILKPPMKTATWEQNTKAKVFKLESAEEFLSTYDRCADWAEILMAQEWVEGTDANLYSCNCYFNENNEPLVTFIARKLRQWPTETGTSCLGEEVRNDEVLEASIRLFKSVGYHGLGYVEMKRDDRTGRHYIIEPNIGRPTGRSAIAEAGGVALVYTMYCDKAGLPLPENREQQYGNAKWIYFRHDLQSALSYWRRGDLSLKDWMQSWRGKKFYAVFDRKDQGPFWADVREVAFKKVWKRLRA